MTQITLKYINKHYISKNVVNLVDRIFLSDSTKIKDIKNFRDIIYDVFLYNTEEKLMYIDIDLYSNKIKPWLNELGKFNYINNKYLTPYGVIRPVFYDGDNKKAIIFIDNKCIPDV